MIAPHNLEAEGAVLGACMTEMTAREATFGILAPGDFYDLRHQALYQAIVTLHGHGQAIDPVTLAAALHAEDRLEFVGGRKALFMMQANTPASGHASTYAAMVADCAARRRLMALSEEIKTRAADQLELTADIIGDIPRLADDIRLPGDQIEPAIDAADLMDEADEDFDWIVPQLLDRGDRLILTAAEGVGKSTALRSWGYMLASGIHPFNRYPIRRLRVLLIDLENSRRQIRKELRPLRAAAGDRYQGGLGIQCWPSGIDLRDPRDFRRVDMLCQIHHPEVLVIGPLYKAFRIRTGERKDGETPAEEAAFALDRLRERHGCALLMEAHAPHGDSGDRAGLRPYGASLWLRWPEFGIGLKRIPGERAVEVKHWRGARDRDREWPEVLHEGSHWPWEAAQPALRAV